MSKKRILIVDDSRSVRTLVGMTLKHSGFDIVEGVSGEDGLEKAADGVYDLVITDLNMPGIDGVELVRRLRAMPALAQTPIFFLTTEVADEFTEIKKELGVVVWFVKPFVPARLIEAVEKVCKRG